MPQMLDRADDFLDIVSRTAERHLTLFRIVSGPGGTFVPAPRQADAADIDYGLAASLEGIDA